MYNLYVSRLKASKLSTTISTMQSSWLLVKHPKMPKKCFLALVHTTVWSQVSLVCHPLHRLTSKVRQQALATLGSLTAITSFDIYLKPCTTFRSCRSISCGAPLSRSVSLSFRPPYLPASVFMCQSTSLPYWCLFRSSTPSYQPAFSAKQFVKSWPSLSAEISLVLASTS